MIIQNKDTNTPVYFGYSDAAKHPTEAIDSVRQVILAMNDMLYNYRDPNDLGEDPDSDTRSGINFIFKACAMQLQAATDAIESTDNNSDAHFDDSYPRLDAIKAEHSETLCFDDWQTAAQWAAHNLDDFPSNRTAAIRVATENAWNKISGISRKRKGRGGGWEYHVSALPPAAQQDFQNRKAFFSTAYNRQATG